MKVTITDKGEGYVTARFEAESNIETLILSTVAPTTTHANISMDSRHNVVNIGPAKPPRAHITFESFTVPTHELLATAMHKATDDK